MYGVGVDFDEASVPWYRYTAADVLTGYAYTEEPDVVRHCVALADPRGGHRCALREDGARGGSLLTPAPFPYPPIRHLGQCH
jgi:hypothetical protein